MVFIYILYLVIFVVLTVVGFICLKIKASGMNVKDFFAFIFAINDLDNLYIFAKCNIDMNEKEQSKFLVDAEKVFEKFDKIPSIIWEEEYEKYEEVLEKYKSIKMLRWSEMTV